MSEKKPPYTYVIAPSYVMFDDWCWQQEPPIRPVESVRRGVIPLIKSNISKGRPWQDGDKLVILADGGPHLSMFLDILRSCGMPESEVPF